MTMVITGIDSSKTLFEIFSAFHRSVKAVKVKVNVSSNNADMAYHHQEVVVVVAVVSLSFNDSCDFDLLGRQ